MRPRVLPPGEVLQPLDSLDLDDWPHHEEAAEILSELRLHSHS